ncbi:bifunctional metallophosphatase/5'-nucleotidase [Metabacillus fastidiosus]|uniref:bifunctional metallophosphatase/5'-nucleotidase n=1 Tax=Metabacillus fastidiosus TaxID=1458 RepID=UPI000825DF52|nr:bifunctional UDP-sugar hydrolase/5'-nucleotidase [Metabacillus fastidiosus]MED4463577.1 bifunctional UDP-sugar hydrolase/5'-nucleotidase [Metabacillus fastidiosus]
MNTIKLSILQTSDIHGHILPKNYRSQEELHLGLGKLSSIIKKEREMNEHVLLIDNGDLIQGTPLTYHFSKKSNEKINPMIKVLNELKYDAAVIGNHEFNYGRHVLNEAVLQSTFPWLSANIISCESNEPLLGKPYMVKSFEGVKIAVLGVTTHYIPNWEDPLNIKGLRFEDALETTKQWVDFIKEKEKPDVMIVSYHGGFERDIETGEPTEQLTGENQAYEICYKVPGIDVLLTGHQHRKISGQLNGVTIVQPSFNGQVIAKIDIILNKENGIKISTKSASLLTMENVKTDQSIVELIRQYEEETIEWLNMPIGEVDGNMEIEDVFELRLKEHPLIEFINKVQMDIAGVSISNTALFHNESPGLPKYITMRDIVANYIYPNTLKVICVTGLDIKLALERSATYFDLDEHGAIVVNPRFSIPKPQHYNYDMWEGIEYILDISKPFGERVTKLMYNGKSLGLQLEYDVVMNNYRAGGGGDYDMYKGKQVVKEIQIDMTELLANYINEHKTIKAEVNHNWKVIW